MADLIVIVPTHGRPQRAAGLAATFDETCTADTEIVYVVGEDDPSLGEYTATLMSTGPRARTIHLASPVDRPSTMCHALNEAARAFAPMSTVAVGFMGDDHRPRTVGWDTAYLDVLRELGTGLVYGNDLLQGARLPTQVAMTTDIVSALGWMAPPDLWHMYTDNFWLALGQRLDRIRYLPQVVVEHVHPVAGKVGWDAGHRRVNAPDVYAHDAAVFEAYLRNHFETDVSKIPVRPGSTVGIAT